MAATLVPAVLSGAAWLESLLHLPQLAEHLEAQRRIPEDVDERWAAAFGRMEAAGLTTFYESPGFNEPRAGRLRPMKVKALSYCYELMGSWSLALDAWTDFLSTFQRPAPPDLARRDYLEAQRLRPPAGPG